MAGAAGAGKSTLGRALARELRAVLLDLDTVTNAVLDGAAAPLLEGRHWNDPDLRDTVRPARYRALREVAVDQRDSGLPVILVAPFTSELQGGAEWDALCAAVDAQPLVVWIAAEPALLTARRAERAADRDAHALPASVDAPAVPHVRVDASLSTAQQVTRVLRALGHHRSVDPDAPIFSRTFSAGLFDLDGTLIDSTAAVSRAWRRIAEEFDIDGDPLTSGHGLPASEIIRRFVAPERIDDALARIIDIESTDVSDVVAIPGSHEFFTAVPSRAIVTSGTLRIAESRLRAAGIARPSALVTFDDVTRGKPDPEPFSLGAHRLHTPASECVVFEDAPAGIAAAKAAGCAVVAITGSHSIEELADADVIVDRLDQLRVTQTGEGFTLSVA